MDATKSMAKKNKSLRVRLTAHVIMFFFVITFGFYTQAAAIKTTVEFSAASTLHGLQYIFESGKNLSLSKVIWLLVVLGATGFGIIWSYQESCD